MKFFKNRKKIRLNIINDLDLRKQARDLGVKIWQTPSFLFIVFGVVAVIIMVATYFISKNYENPRVLVISESLIVITILIVEMLINNFVNQMAKLNKMKSEFVAIASHQLRTPLSSIKWESELLLCKTKIKCKSKTKITKKQYDSINNIAAINDRMIRLVNDLLDVARIDQNRLILRKQKIDLLKVVEEIVEEFASEAKSKHIKINISCEKELPSVLGDRDKVALVVGNLIDNAIKYTRNGGKVEIKIFKRRGSVVIEVKDNGVGIPEEQAERVFEKFFRSDNSAKYQTEGTGLGLYIAKNVIEQLGGEIWFNSIENVGSMFGFSLPINNNK